MISRSDFYGQDGNLGPIFTTQVENSDQLNASLMGDSRFILTLGIFSWKGWGADRVSLEATGEVDSFEPNRLLRFRWNYGLEGGPTLVECSTGWGEALALLKIYLEHNITYN